MTLQWHVDGHGRSSYIPPERRQGFQYWKALECTHNYNESYYYADDGSPGNDSEVQRKWDGYDARAQTDDAEAFLRRHAEQQRGEDEEGQSSPFLLMLSWGPPHNPVRTTAFCDQQPHRPLCLTQNAGAVVPPTAVYMTICPTTTTTTCTAVRYGAAGVRRHVRSCGDPAASERAERRGGGGARGSRGVRTVGYS